MTNDQIRRKIAEACGFESIREDEGGRLWGERVPFRALYSIPNYPESHDAMAEALGTLDDGELNMYAECLIGEVAIGALISWHDVIAVLEKTPIQKAEAFLRAKELWEDGE